MGDINWTYQIINWAVSILLTPLITFLITWYKMRKQHKNNLIKLFENHKNDLIKIQEQNKKDLDKIREQNKYDLDKIEKQHENEIDNLKQLYINNRNSKINDLKIQKLTELYDMLAKEATSINYITHANLSYFHKILNKQIKADDNTWEEHNKSILENEKTKINYIPQIRNRLLSIPDFKENFKKESIEIDSKSYNYINFDLAVKYNKPQHLSESAQNNNLTTDDLDKYMSFSQRYFELIETLSSKVEKEIETIIENDTEIK